MFCIFVFLKQFPQNGYNENNFSKIKKRVISFVFFYKRNNQFIVFSKMTLIYCYIMFKFACKDHECFYGLTWKMLRY